MLPKVNENLFIQVLSLDEEESNKEYKSRIADVNAQTISIEVPIDVHSGRLKRLLVGDQLNVYYINANGVKNYFNTDVLGYREDTIRLVAIRTPEPDAITQVQRRNYLRVPAELEVSVQLSDHYRFLTMTEDVGGGGVSFQCGSAVPLKRDDTVNCWLLIPYRNGSVEHACFSATVVRMKKLESGRQLVMLVFSEILEAERQKVIRYCFERQLEFRKR